MAEIAASKQPVGVELNNPLIGREAELTRIQSVWQAVVDRSGQVVLLSGEAGIGKTRLAEEILARIGPKCVALIGRCFEQQSSIPFFAFSEAIGEAWSTAPTALMHEGGQPWSELAFIVPDLLPATDVTPAKIDSQATQLRVFQRATQFLGRLAEIQPVVLLLEDLHWADATSLDLLVFLVRHIADKRLLIVGTYRDPEAGRHNALNECLSQLARERVVSEIHLCGLSRDDTRALVHARLGELASDELVKTVHDRTGGNPFFTQELLKALLEQRVLIQGHSPDIDAIAIPRSVRSVVGGRVARLLPGAQEVLALASVIGEQFSVDLLLAASERNDQDVFFDELDAALAAGLIKAQRDGRRERYTFSHALVQQTLYQEIPLHRRQRLHAQVGSVLEALPNVGAERAADLARHFGAAGDAQRAIRYGIQAGDQAAARYAHAEAAASYHAVLDLLVEDSDRARAAEVRRRLGDELYDLNRLPEALAEFASALSEFELLGDTMGQALVHQSAARLHQAGYEMVAATGHLDAALRLWPAERQDAELAGLLLNAARARMFAGIWDAEHRSMVERAMALAERLGEPALLARALVEPADLETAFVPSVRLPRLDRAETLARSARAFRVLHRIYMDRAVMHQLGGDLESGLADRLKAAEAAERAGETKRVAFAYGMAALAHELLGSWEQGRALMHTSEMLDPTGPLGRGGAAHLAWMEGRHHDVLGLLPAHVAAARQRGDIQDLVVSSGDFAAYALRLGCPELTETLIREVAELVCASTGRFQHPGNVMGELAETVARLAAPDADIIVDHAVRQIQLSEQYVALPQILRARALNLRRRGDLGRALEAINESVRIARSQRATLQLGISRFLQADLARANGDAVLAREADDERHQIVAAIGPEVLGLDWTRDIRIRRPHPATGGNVLSPREDEVAELIAEGHSNRQIAEALVISERTAEKHVSTVLAKLGFDSRAQIAAWVTRRHHQNT